MYDLFKNLWNKTSCKKSGICSINPIINALDAVIMNEIRQIALYAIKLKELNFTNREMTKKTISALAVNISDTSFNKSSMYAFYNELKEIKEKFREFYVKKSLEMNISYEFITPDFSESKDDSDINNLIKNGENIVRQLFNSVEEEKIRLLNVIIFTSKMTAVTLCNLALYKDVDFDYYFEILRLLSLTNYLGVREEKLSRRIKEFSEIIYKIQAELDYEYELAYGKKESIKTSTDIKEGPCVLVSGGSLYELYDFLEKTREEEVNVYLTPSMACAFAYPKFREYKNLTGIFGTGDPERDFTDFTGPVYITKNSTKNLDSIFRGTIFTTKLIHSDKIKSLKDGEYTPLIEEAKRLEGFSQATVGEEVSFEYNLRKIENILSENENGKVLCAIGSLNEEEKQKFKNHTVINFALPNETEGLHFVADRHEGKNLSFCFSDCTQESINTIISLLSKTPEEIYVKNCFQSDINPHVTEALTKDFKIKTL